MMSRRRSMRKKGRVPDHHFGFGRGVVSVLAGLLTEELII